jgi:hypothetical protein
MLKADTLPQGQVPVYRHRCIWPGYPSQHGMGQGTGNGWTSLKCLPL